MKSFFLSLAAIGLICASSFVSLQAAESSSEADSFRLLEVEVIEPDVVEVTFSRGLSTDPAMIMDFILEKSSDFSEIAVLLSEVNKQDSSKVLLMLEKTLEENTEYSITALDVKDANGNTIESGIDAFLTFNTGVMSIADTTASKDTEKANSKNSSEDLSKEILLEEEKMSELPEEDLSLEAGGPEVVTSGDNSSISQMAGDTVSSTTTENYTTQTAAKNETLPQTGPELILLVLLSLAGAGGYIFFLQRKTS